MNYTKEIIQTKIIEEQKWLERAIIVIYQNQTNTEQSNKSTGEKNGVGFTSFDAKTLSYYAQYLLRHKNNHLSGEYLEKAKKLMPKYWKQILIAIQQNQ